MIPIWSRSPHVYLKVVQRHTLIYSCYILYNHCDVLERWHLTNKYMCVDLLLFQSGLRFIEHGRNGKEYWPPKLNFMLRSYHCLHIAIYYVLCRSSVYHSRPNIWCLCLYNLWYIEHLKWLAISLLYIAQSSLDRGIPHEWLSLSDMNQLWYIYIIYIYVCVCVCARVSILHL